MTSSTKAKTAKSQKPAVRVRMYRQGLGDCFLLTFSTAGKKPAHMLIDCGTLGAATTNVPMSAVVADIRKETKAHLDVVVATHEHLDHLSGFRDHREVFKNFKIDQVWLAWTENPDDALAREVARTNADLGLALAKAAMQLAAANDGRHKEMGAAIHSLMEFNGEQLAAAANGLGFSTTVNDTMKSIRTWPNARTRYLDPGAMIFDKELVPGFRFYVLGPPRSLNKLKLLGTSGSDELYGLVSALAGEDHARYEQPFNARFNCTTDKTLAPDYDAPENAWRRIDADWLDSTSNLALQLDSLTNNTSLALAIERISDGKVLLFPADAQLGNWTSWHDDAMKWRQPGGTDGAGQKNTTVRDLLARTVFYKVGHHASHNGTASAQGLELMTRANELVAFIPVDRKVALSRNPKGSWKMPAPDLYRRLLEQCQGRVARSDIGWATDPAKAADKTTEKDFASLAAADEWKTWARKQKTASVKVEELYIDYTLR